MIEFPSLSPTLRAGLGTLSLKPRSILILVFMILVPGCGGGGSSGGGGAAGAGGDEGGSSPDAESFPTVLVDDFDSLRTTRWDLELDEDVEAPMAEGGLLRFRWSGASAVSRARLVLKRAGFYESAGLDVPVLDDGVEARITIDFLGSGQARRASLGLQGAASRTVEVLIEDGNGRQVKRVRERFSNLDLPFGASDERVRFEVDTDDETIRFYFAEDLLFAYTEPGLRVPDNSQIAIEVEGRETQGTAIECFEAAQLSAVRQRRLTDVRANHIPPSRVQWLLKLRDAQGDIVTLDPEQVETVVPTVFEYGVPVDVSETCPVIRTFGALPLQVAIVLDHTLSMEAFGGLGPMKDSAIELLKVLADSHTFSIWEFHDNPEEGGFSQLMPPGGTLEQGRRVIEEFEPNLRGFSLCWDTLDEVLEKDFESDEEDETVSPLRVIVFFSDGVDTSSDATPRDLIREAEEKEVLLYSFGYGRLTPDSRLDLVDLGQATGGLFAEALTPGQIIPEFRGLIEELSGYLQLAYVTGRVMDRRIDSLVSLEQEGLGVQQFIRDRVDGEEISFNDDEVRYDTQTGLLTLDGPSLQEDGEVLELSVRAVHVPRETEEWKLTVEVLEMDGETPIPVGSALSVEPEPGGPFEDWTGMQDGQVFRFKGAEEACFGDFGPLVQVSLRTQGLPAQFVLRLTVDNMMYNGLLRFASSLDVTGNDDWVVTLPISQE